MRSVPDLKKTEIEIARPKQKTHSSGGQSRGHDIRYPVLSCDLTSALRSSLNGAAPVYKDTHPL